MKNRPYTLQKTGQTSPTFRVGKRALPTFGEKLVSLRSVYGRKSPEKVGKSPKIFEKWAGGNR